jgi:hypothetical protein
MKKILVALALALYATSSFATVANSPHDFNASATPGFNSSGTNYSMNKASRCQYCHVPHAAQAWASVALWATGQAAGSFTYYSSANVVVTSIDKAQSQTCLACHADGTTVITGLATAVTGPAMIGYNLQLSHPVGDQVVLTPGQNSMQTTISIGRLNLGTTGSTTVQCATCHSVHGFGKSTIIGRKLLYGPGNAGPYPNSTDFCTICHNR